MTTPATFTCIHWDNVLPTPRGTIAKTFAKVNIDSQVKQAEEMATFLITGGDPAKLAHDTTLVPFLVALPGNTRKVRIVYGIATGFGLTGLNINPLQTNILALTGEHSIDQMEFPTVLTFPPNIITPIPISFPTDAQFEAERKKLGGTNNDEVNKKITWSTVPGMRFAGRLTNRRQIKTT